MEEKELSPKESLDLINSMIGKARERYTDNSFHFLLWGWLVILASVLHYWFAVEAIIEEPQMAWIIMPIGAIISTVYGIRQDKRARVTHYTDKLYGWLWMSIGVSMVIIIVNGQYLNFQIIPLILMVAGIGTFVSGSMMKVKILQLGAICLWVGSIAAFQFEELYQLPINALSIAIGYLLPGYIMKSKAKKHGI